MHLVFGNINCKVAPLWKRFGAAAIDGVIVGALVFVPYVNFALMIGYALVRDSWRPLKGQSIGKRIFGIRVMNQFTGLDLMTDYHTDISRNLPLLIFGIDLFVILFSPINQRIGDRRARTIVVNDTLELNRFNALAIRDKKRFVNLFDDYDSHGVHHDE